MQDIKIVVGSFAYCCRQSRILFKEGWVLIDEKRWADGRYNFKFKRKESA